MSYFIKSHVDFFRRAYAHKSSHSADAHHKTASTMTKSEDEKDSVTLYEYGKVNTEPPLSKDWPSGEDIIKMLEKQGVNAAAIGGADYWQTSARWALLQKYKHLPEDLQHKYVTKEEGVSQLCFSDDDIKTIRSMWNWNMLEENAPSDNDDLQEFMKTSKSCGRQLQWTVMDCARATQFKLHAHPNLELIYCARGALHEIRMSGEPLTRDFGPTGQVQGPNLTQLDRPWNFATLNEGQWLVNEVGSIHKSFTATNQACTLLVLWGGSHADVSPEQHPKLVNVQQALNTMDDRLCDCSKGARLSETFLPESERGST